MPVRGNYLEFAGTGKINTEGRRKKECGYGFGRRDSLNAELVAAVKADDYKRVKQTLKTIEDKTVTNLQHPVFKNCVLHDAAERGEPQPVCQPATDTDTRYAHAHAHAHMHAHMHAKCWLSF